MPADQQSQRPPAGSESEPEPELEPSLAQSAESTRRSVVANRPSDSGAPSAGDENSVTFAGDTKENDGPQQSGAARTTGRLLGKAVVATLGQIGALCALFVLGVLCVRAWSGSLFLWRGSLDEAWSKTHSWAPPVRCHAADRHRSVTRTASEHCSATRAAASVFHSPCCSPCP